VIDYALFYKNNFVRTRGSYLLKIKVLVKTKYIDSSVEKMTKAENLNFTKTTVTKHCKTAVHILQHS